ncbi:HNH endonuclease [Paenarthrobacter nicotinovorans]|uniref:HNH endonuclease n=1 Tax=Paenarthrobacter nicotinovorans TaxID=29320 RepID=UPI00166A47F6|nr:HNH endonuclease signature motif containing protein [Paenarthrobacter nicotinovorans]MBP2393603.1 hypothetical protein [Paenarthrobacter nicotinovorans]UKF00148.1 HNH endonuclease [Paenarthrobacter nicotinovorans]UKF04930.1 HNH endonuclease [Paenarthrobacter nicotinovorans]GGV33471.1 hypothetical protein GCM10010212_21700 [Paenarthrobacter nicotinovorans]
MGSIGDVLARRAGSPGAKVLPRRVRHSEKTGSTASLAAALTGSDPGARPTAGMSFEGRAGAAGLAESLALGAAAVAAVRSLAAEETRLFDFTEAADFAGSVEEISRALEYLQVVAAQTVERTRTEAQRAAPAQQPGQSPASGAQEWRTGWTEPAGESEGGGGGDSVLAAAADGADGADGAGGGSVLDDGYRNAAEFLRARLRIGIGEARRRLALATDVLPGAGITGQEIPARRQRLADALHTGQVPSRSATIISTALDKAQHFTDPDTLTGMEHALTTTATQSDPDFVTTMANRWIDHIDHNGPEPTEEALRHVQGAFLRRQRRHGLHHLEIFATTEQYETLTTAMNAATNPRLTNTTGPDQGTVQGTVQGTALGADHGTATASAPDAGVPNGAGPGLDRRSRAQKLLDGLVGACAVAMTTGKLPSNGGLRPQLTVTIDHHDLFQQLTHTTTSATEETNTPKQPRLRNTVSTGTATFTGPIHPNTIRKIACDADILPVLLGTDSQILDIGRTTRIFPPHIRKAITARDQGCAFPDCTLPAPWCEAHHITYWSQGGTTGTNNATLLCTHHHHLIHKEHWRITIQNGVPWFIPPPHIDPHQTPRRNHHHTPPRT